MIYISYDISDDKLRTRFSKFIKKFGYRVQYSVFEITNSRRILNNIMIDIHDKFEEKFSQDDSVIIIETSETCHITKFGFAKQEENDLIMIG
jgi:CRISPR-associated protein Cas2